MKCLKKWASEQTRTIYTRVPDDTAKAMVRNEQWEYCSKSEYKRMTAEQDHG